VTYSGSTKELAEHGGFAHDDNNVMMLLSNPSFRPTTATTPVTTAQVALAILKVLALNPQALRSIREKGYQGASEVLVQRQRRLSLLTKRQATFKKSAALKPCTSF